MDKNNSFRCIKYSLIVGNITVIAIGIGGFIVGLLTPDVLLRNDPYNASRNYGVTGSQLALVSCIAVIIAAIGLIGAIREHFWLLLLYILSLLGAFIFRLCWSLTTHLHLGERFLLDTTISLTLLSSLAKLFLLIFAILAAFTIYNSSSANKFALFKSWLKRKQHPKQHRKKRHTSSSSSSSLKGSKAKPSSDANIYATSSSLYGSGRRRSPVRNGHHHHQQQQQQQQPTQQPSTRAKKYLPGVEYSPSPNSSHSSNDTNNNQRNGSRDVEYARSKVDTVDQQNQSQTWHPKKLMNEHYYHFQAPTPTTPTSTDANFSNQPFYNYQIPNRNSLPRVSHSHLAPRVTEKLSSSVAKSNNFRPLTLSTGNLPKTRDGSLEVRASYEQRESLAKKPETPDDRGYYQQIMSPTVPVPKPRAAGRSTTADRRSFSPTRNLFQLDSKTEFPAEVKIDRYSKPEDRSYSSNYSYQRSYSPAKTKAEPETRYNGSFTTTIPKSETFGENRYSGYQRSTTPTGTVLKPGISDSKIEDSKYSTSSYQRSFSPTLRTVPKSTESSFEKSYSSTNDRSYQRSSTPNKVEIVPPDSYYRHSPSVPTTSESRHSYQRSTTPTSSLWKSTGGVPKTESTTESRYSYSKPEDKGYQRSTTPTKTYSYQSSSSATKASTLPVASTSTYTSASTKTYTLEKKKDPPNPYAKYASYVSPRAKSTERSREEFFNSITSPSPPPPPKTDYRQYASSPSIIASSPTTTTTTSIFTTQTPLSTIKPANLFNYSSIKPSTITTTNNNNLSQTRNLFSTYTSPLSELNTSTYTRDLSSSSLSRSKSPIITSPTPSFKDGSDFRLSTSPITPVTTASSSSTLFSRVYPKSYEDYVKSYRYPDQQTVASGGGRSAPRTWTLTAVTTTASVTTKPINQHTFTNVVHGFDDNGERTTTTIMSTTTTQQEETAHEKKSIFYQQIIRES